MKSIIHNVKGKPIKLHPVSIFASYINRDKQTIKRWEKEGILPKAPFSVPHGDKEVRLYPDYFLRAVKSVVEELKLRRGLVFDKALAKSRIQRAIREEKEKAKL